MKRGGSHQRASHVISVIQRQPGVDNLTLNINVFTLTPPHPTLTH